MRDNVEKWIKLFTSKQFLMFVATGGFAALVNFGSRIVFNKFLDFTISIICAYVCGMIIAFILSKLFVFKAKGQNTTKKEMIYFTLVNIVAVAQTLLVSILLREYVLPAIHWQYYPNEVAHLIGVCVPIFSSYWGHKYFTFSSARNVKHS